MKKILAGLILLITALCANAQKDVTQFLGIPIDGTKAQMIQKLKAKGFRQIPYTKDLLEGEFNGYNVNIGVATNGNKVYRIVVFDANGSDERAIQIRFNELCRQFENNPKYKSSGANQMIADDEDISYETIVNHKRYEAVFFQQPVSVNKTVWFMIKEQYGKYFIVMFYDNEYNRAKGEDL